jgi:hypothetical protein
MRAQLLSALWHGSDPFVGFPIDSHPPDHQGWNSEHHYLVRAIYELNPSVVVEIGGWRWVSLASCGRGQNAMSGLTHCADACNGVVKPEDI